MVTLCCPRCGSTELRESSRAMCGNQILHVDFDCLEEGCGGILELVTSRTIPTSERLPTLYREDVDNEFHAVWAYEASSDYWGEAWLIDTRMSDDEDLEWAWMNDRISGAPSHWMPKPPKPA